MEYYWPKLSEKGIDTGLIRIGYAHGLGNLLNAWARCYVYAHKKGNVKNMIAPTWPQFSLNQWRHNDKDKRLYSNLFTNKYYINGLRKQFILNTYPKFKVNETDTTKKHVKTFEIDGKSGFSAFLHEHQLIYDELIKITNPKHKKGLDFDFSNAISMHIRFGDFKRYSRSTELDFFINTLTDIREKLNSNVKCYIFSDAEDAELEELLKLENVERISFGSSIADILGLSNSKAIIASKGSTFNKWASFLGRMPIIFPEKNFLNLYYDAPELELTLQKDEQIPENFLIEIKKVLDC
ncbi:MAG: hypothetical protein GYB35_01660 [Algicola sp.]|nr:hypothetical protein [Algicola sp.]